jgi:hypothetical protein
MGRASTRAGRRELHGDRADKPAALERGAGERTGVRKCSTLAEKGCFTVGAPGCVEAPRLAARPRSVKWGPAPRA